MGMLVLNHKQADYLCPVNGLCDIFEWKTGLRIPEALLHNACIGFKMIVNKRSPVPRMVFLSHLSVGRRQYAFWASRLGYDIFAGEGKSFQTAMHRVTELIDQGIPVILFGLDMFHLSYQEKFYHSLHVAGHIVLLVGYDHEKAYVHDNSKDGIQEVMLSDLCLAWENGCIPGISRKNAYFGICMDKPNDHVSAIVREAFHFTAKMFLHPPASFIGQNGMQRLISELPQWSGVFSREAVNSMLLHFATYTGSILPELPDEIRITPLGISNPHRGGRDRLSMALLAYKDTLCSGAGDQLMDCLNSSGCAIEAIVSEITKDMLHDLSFDARKYAELFETLKAAETPVYSLMEDF